MDELQKIDLIRERLGVSYTQAKAALDQAGGDVVQALINLENRKEGVDQRLFSQLGNLTARVRTILNKGKVNKVRLKKGDQVLFEVPAAVGAAGVVAMILSTPLAVIGGTGAIFAMLNDYTLEIEKENGETEIERFDL